MFLAKVKLVLLVVLFSSSLALGQGSWDVGLEFQAYPTGIIPGLRVEKNFGERHAAHLRVGANIFDHRHLAKHYSEVGSGYGFTLGYKRYFQTGHERLFLGVRSDLWFNTVDWGTEKLPISMGKTKITVVQPTLEGGFTFVKNQLFFTPTIGFGFEINVVTDGEDTGEGPIVLLGVGAGYRF